MIKRRKSSENVIFQMVAEMAFAGKSFLLWVLKKIFGVTKGFF